MPSHFVNLWQSKEERREKYHLARSLGCNAAWANRMKDWRLSKIERLFGLIFPEHHRNAPIYSPYAQFALPGFYSLVDPMYNKTTDAVQSNSSPLAGKT